MSIEGVTESEGELGIPADLPEIDVPTQKVDFEIYSSQRPKICTDFQEIKLFEKSKIIVVLSDGSQWNIVAEDVSKAFETILKSWVIGDDIRIGKHYDSTKDAFILKNVRDETAYLVELDDKCASTVNALSIKAIDQSGYAIITSDDKLWVTGYIGAITTQYWRVGDRVIINKGSHGSSYDDYNMINSVHPTIAIWMTQVFNNQQILG